MTRARRYATRSRASTLAMALAAAGCLAVASPVLAKNEARFGDSPEPSFSAPAVPSPPATTRAPGGKLPTVDDPAYAAFQKGEYAKALELAKKDAAAGQPQSFTLIGQIYEQGLGVVRNQTEAAKWYEDGASRNDPNSQYALAVMLSEGRGTKRDLKRAATLFERAAVQNLPEAQYSLGVAHAAGRGLPIDLDKARQWLQKAADQNLAKAQYDLGTMYRPGQTLDADEAKAAEWIGRAAGNGHIEAELEYGLMLFLGKGVAKDEKRGADFLRRAAEKGNAVAQNRIARLYANGLVYKKDTVEAAKWHLLARAEGVADLTLDFLVMKLTPDERRSADAKADEWRDRGRRQ